MRPNNHCNSMNVTKFNRPKVCKCGAVRPINLIQLSVEKHACNDMSTSQPGWVINVKYLQNECNVNVIKFTTITRLI